MRNKIVTIGLALCVVSATVKASRAQGTYSVAQSGSRNAVLDLAPELGGKPDVRVTPGYYDLREEMINLADTVQQFARIAPPGSVDTDSLEQAKQEIQQIPAAQMDAFRRVVDPAKVHAQLERARAALGKYSRLRTAMDIATDSNGKSRHALQTSDTFPGANETCVSDVGVTSATDTDVTRIPTDIVLAADLVWQTADFLRESLQDACKETVAGENTSLACVIVDQVWVTAKFVDFTIHFCDDDVTGAVGDASYNRLSFINDEIAQLQNGLNTVTSNVTSATNQVSNVGSQISAIGSQISGVDNHLSSLDNHISQEFGALDAHLTSLVNALSTQVAQVQASVDLANQRLVTLQTSVDLANQRLLKTLAQQTQVMKLDLTPQGQRVIAPAIFTCTGSNCPNVLSSCTGPGGACTWNNVGPLP